MKAIKLTLKSGRVMRVLVGNRKFRKHNQRTELEMLELIGDVNMKPLLSARLYTTVVYQIRESHKAEFLEAYRRKPRVGNRGCNIPRIRFTYTQTRYKPMQMRRKFRALPPKVV